MTDKKWNNDDPPPTPISTLYPQISVCGWSHLSYVRCGLQNLGNSCFMNAIIQALFHLPLFVTWLDQDFKSHKEKCLEQEQLFRMENFMAKKKWICATCHLKHAFEEMNHSAEGVYSPRQMFCAMKTLCQNLTPGRQEDGHEFFVLMMDRLEDEFLKRFLPTKFDYISKLTNPLSQMFIGWHKCTCFCKTCSFTSTTYSAFGHLSVDVGKCKNIQDALNSIFHREELKLICRNCKKEGQVEKVLSIHKSPLYLLILIERFDPSSNMKNSSPINVDQYVTLCGGDRYQLQNAVLHLGVNRNNGHYVTMARDIDNKSVLRFDDSQIRRCDTFNSVEATRSCYMLFYSQVQVKVPVNRPPASENNNISETAITSPSKGAGFSGNNWLVSPIKVEPPKTVPPVKILKRQRLVPKDSSSQSSHDYSIIKETMADDDFNKKLVKSPPKEHTRIRSNTDLRPISILKKRRTTPKTSSSQSSNEYAIKETLESDQSIVDSTEAPLSQACASPSDEASPHKLTAVTPEKKALTPIKILRRKRTEEKVHSSQSSHDYSILKDNLHFLKDSVNQKLLNNFSNAPESKEKSEENVPSSPLLNSQQPPSPNSDLSQVSLTNENVSLEDAEDHLISNVNGNVLDPKLFVDDVRGAKLPLPVIEDNIVPDLRRYLSCRGLQVKGVKAELVSRIKDYQKLGKKDILDPKIDAGIWYELKKLALQNSQGVSQIVREFPDGEWKIFPSASLPKNFNFGRIYDYLVESTPQFTDPNHPEELVETDSDEESIGSVSPDDNNADPFADETQIINTTKKLRRGYQFMKSRHARKIQDHDTSLTYFVRCDMKASMEKSVYRVQVAISKLSGNIKLCECNCKCSALGRCSHVSGLLLHIWSHIKLNGYGALTCTSQPCVWNKGSLKRNPGNIIQKQYESFKIDVKKRGSFDVRPFRYQVSEISSEVLNRFVANLTGNPYTTLWETHLSLQYSDFDLSVEDAQIVRLQCLEFIMEMRRVPADAIVLASKTDSRYQIPNTQGQAKSSMWMAARSVRITASIAHRVMHLTDRGKLSFLKNNLWGMNIVTTNAMKYGTDNEPKARSAYLKFRRKIDDSAIIEHNYGLVVRCDYPELGCSPDGVVFSKKCATRLLEIKCPFSLRNLDPSDFEEHFSANQKKRFCIARDSEGSLYLKQNHSYYYQVQLSLGILGYDVADFVVFSTKGLIVVTVPFDENLWNEVATKLRVIHHQLIVPEYYLMRAPRDLNPIELKYDNDCTEISIIKI